MYFDNSYCLVNNCIIDSTWRGISLQKGGVISNTIIKNSNTGIGVVTDDEYSYIFNNNIFRILPGSGGAAPPKGIYNLDYGGSFTITNNILLTTPSDINYYGIEITANKKVIIKNNLIYGFRYGIGSFAMSGAADTTFILNNVIAKSYIYGIEIGNLPKHYKIKNNIFTNNYKGVYSYGNQGDVDYNLFFNNTYLMYQNIPAGAHDIKADPMFVNDTLPIVGGTFDYRLQKYSPAIDKGIPNIFDINGSRSDIGMYGGPLGESYVYKDLAPKPVKNVAAFYEQEKNRVKLTWDKNTEADFKTYYVYKDINPNFVLDSTKKIVITTEPIFYDTLNKGTLTIYYKITAVDSSENESFASTEVNVNITNNEDALITENYSYELYQNYPNPFNPNTTISYSLKEPGEVRIKLYTITGELIKTLLEGAKSKGYNETQIDLSCYSSGIYLYRLEVTGAGKIPVFNDLKKMVLLK